MKPRFEAWLCVFCRRWSDEPAACEKCKRKMEPLVADGKDAKELRNGWQSYLVQTYGARFTRQNRANWLARLWAKLRPEQS